MNTVVVLKTIYGKTIKLNLDNYDATVADIKEKLLEIEGFPKQQIKLFYGGIMLDDKQSLKEVGYISGNTMMLQLKIDENIEEDKKFVEKLKLPKMCDAGKIFVKTLNEKIKEFTIIPKKSVYELKMQITKEENFPSDQYDLVFNGKLLKPEAESLE